MLIDALVRVFGANLPVFALLFVGIAVEKYYVSRVTVFTNVIALNVSFLSLDQVPRSLVWYGDIGLLLGLYGMAAYLLNVKTSKVYNIPAFTMYASLPVAAVILVSPGDWWTALLVAGLVNFVAGEVFESGFDVAVVHWGPRPGPVSRFIKSETMEYIDPMGVRQKVDLEIGFDP
ncbi:hypothetical protein [Halorussus marinus]|uniref:hypothetical protein n=1 Tax=Halorussus marinus TaxID=2505976 RepID=UPI00106E3A10|nr:hypothetical protein [Halorussus marinus]